MDYMRTCFACPTGGAVPIPPGDPLNRHYACTYPTRVFKDGKITLKGTCASKKGRQVAIEATGSYSPSTFKLTADVDTTYAGIPLGGRFITDAKKISDTCPAGAKEG